MALIDEKQHQSGIVKKSILIHVSNDKAWKNISNVVGLFWVIDVKNAIFLSKNRRGVGVIRKITFNDGNGVEETIVGWRNRKYLSYIATSGLPLRAYHATISIKSIKKKLVKVTWQSFFNSEKMTKNEFLEFQNYMNSFYKNSLSNLKSSLEKI
jgi:hypothetical protein